MKSSGWALIQYDRRPYKRGNLVTETHTEERWHSKSRGADFPGGAVDTNLLANAGNTGATPGPGRFHVRWSKEVHAPQPLSQRSRAHAPSTATNSSPCSLELEKV